MGRILTTRSLRRIFGLSLAAGVTVALWTLLSTTGAPERPSPRHSSEPWRQRPQDPESLAAHLEANPENARGWRHLARMWTEAGEEERAREALVRAEEALVAQMDALPTQDVFERAEAWGRLAQVRSELGAESEVHAAYGRAADLLQAAADVRDGARTRFELACYAALAGQQDRAIEALERAVELGLGRRRRWVGDPRLESLREDPRFAALVERAQRRTVGG